MLFTVGILVLSAFSLISAAPGLHQENGWVFIADPNGKLHLINTDQELPDVEVTPDDVTFYLYTRESSKPSLLNLYNYTEIKKTPFSPSRSTWIVTHGWMNNFQSSVGQMIKNALLAANDVNVFVTDWGDLAGDYNYVNSAGAVKSVGNLVGEFAKGVAKVSGAALNKFHLCGHSLGAHVSGNAGQAIGSVSPFIMGMDPAAPMISFEEVDKRLDPSDGQVVHVIHTCAGKLGYVRPIGDADFYPNGGSYQPGCGMDVTGSCSHGRSYEYFAESILGGKFTGHECDTYESWQQGLCEGLATARMGGLNFDTKAYGSFFLITNDKAPYAMG